MFQIPDVCFKTETGLGTTGEQHHTVVDYGEVMRRLENLVEEKFKTQSNADELLHGMLLIVDDKAWQISKPRGDSNKWLMPAAGTIESTSTIQLSSTVLKKLLDRRISPSFAFLSSSLTAKGDTGKLIRLANILF